MVMGEVRILEYNNQVTHCRSFVGCQFPLCCMPQSTVATSSITCTALNIRQVIRFGPGVFINCRIVARGPQQAEILDTDAEIRDPKSQAIFSDYFRKIRKFISRELQCETSCYGV